jgi:hypothetical protein
MLALVDCRRELGVEPFNSLLAQAIGNTRLAAGIASMLDELDCDGGNTA